MSGGRDRRPAPPRSPRDGPPRSPRDALPRSRRDAIAQALDVIAPAIPAFDRDAVLDHAQDSAGLRTASPQAAAWLSLVAHIRHLHTEYDALLADGYGAEAARHFVVADINRVLAEWGCRRRADGESQKDIDSSCRPR